MKIATCLPLNMMRMFCALIVISLAMPMEAVFITKAHAQEAETRRPGGLLRFLFPPKEPPRQERVAPPQTKRRAAPSNRRATTAAPQQQATQAVEKAENAKRVLIIGDFVAGGLADGLVVAYAENPDVLIIDRSNGSSGLVRDDYYDWPGQIGALIETEKPNVVITMIGSNDRQQMRVGNDREQPRSEAWTTEYERRITSLAKSVRDKNLPLLWVGNLPFKAPAMSSDMIAFNDIYRRIVTDLGGEFIDVWDGFVDESGQFASAGPDMNGQPAQLRASDGINITRQGRRKLAFYVEKPLNNLLDTGTVPQAPGILIPGDDILVTPGLENSVAPAVVRTAPMAIDDLALETSSGLLGATITPRNGEPRTPAEKLIRDGVAPEMQPGRADYFLTKRPGIADNTLR